VLARKLPRERVEAGYPLSPPRGTLHRWRAPRRPAGLSARADCLPASLRRQGRSPVGDGGSSAIGQSAPRAIAASVDCSLCVAKYCGSNTSQARKERPCGDAAGAKRLGIHAPSASPPSVGSFARKTALLSKVTVRTDSPGRGLLFGVVRRTLGDEVKRRQRIKTNPCPVKWLRHSGESSSYSYSYSSSR
jgi:hypothetical protein